MQVNELRIGNFIIPKDETINMFRVDTISYNNIGVYIAIMYCDFPNKNQVLRLNLEDAKGIALTEELLLKCGFEKETGFNPELECLGVEPPECKFIKNDCLIFCNYLKEDLFKLTLSKYNVSPSIGYMLIGAVKHMHELQNLYFALTGKELEVKL